MHVPNWILTGAGKLGLRTITGWLELSNRKEQDAEIQELRRELEVARAKLAEYESIERMREQFAYSTEGGIYWRNDGSGPYCSACTDIDDRPVRLVPIGNSLYDCPKHTNLRYDLGKTRQMQTPLPRRHHPRRMRY